MLRRQKIILALLDRATKPLSQTMFVKLAFLLRQETEIGNDTTYYGFVPYHYGPFSFALYRELEALVRKSYIVKDDDGLHLDPSMAAETRRLVADLPGTAQTAIDHVSSRYGSKAQKTLLRDVYARYPWFATKTERKDLLPATMPLSPSATPAVYTIGYEGDSIDGFFDRILRTGIRGIADVRSNPVSRKYGFARSSLSGIAKKLGINYRHHPELGISGVHRAGLNGFASYQRLLDQYERTMLPRQTVGVAALAEVVRSEATALLCVESDVRCCHRSRLAVAIAGVSGLPVIHLE
ncbi:MAG: hypothetical protein FLDDKLPJ_00384 [Phycisphaerae bacterium]|nr:hypothetical protein [Phycisphaerae bacterium]